MSETSGRRSSRAGMPMRIACLEPDGWPYITVCWHDWHDGSFWLVPRQRSRWAELLERDGRLSFVVDDAKTMEKVIGRRRRGARRAAERRRRSGSRSRRACRSATSGQNGPKYLTPTLNQPRWLFRFAHER